MSHCVHCGRRLPPSDATGPRRFDTTRCRKRAYRRRQAGLPENAYPDGAARGQVALRELTRAQQRQRWEKVLDELRRTRDQINPRSHTRQETTS